MTNIAEFESFVLEGIESVDRVFPSYYRDDEADFCEVFFCGEEFHGERVDGRLTVFRGRNSGEPVGFMLKDMKRWVNRILRQVPLLRFEIHDGKIKLGLLFVAHSFVEPNPSDSHFLSTVSADRGESL